MPDVVIVGGGIAGSALAILLGRRGLRVELLERGAFPREKPCGEGLMPAGVAVLRRMGLAEAVGGVPFVGIRYHTGGRVIAGRFPRVGGQTALGRGQRRWLLDEVLFETAADTSGVEARTGCTVDGPVVASGRVIGCTADGWEHRAALVVGADGLHSHFRRSLGLEAPPPRRVRVGLRTHFRLRAGAATPAWVDVYLGRRHELYVTPLPEGEVLVAGLAERDAVRRPGDQVLREWIGQQAALAEQLDGATQLTRIEGRSPLTQQAVRAVGPGFALLGDAAGFLDPITGGGMAQALLTAELLARHIENGLGTGDAWLWAFEAERRVLLRDYRWLTSFVLALADHRWAVDTLLALMAAAPGLMSHLVGVAGGVRCLSSLKTPPVPAP